MFPRSVAGRQKITTRISAHARFTIKKFVTVLILGDRKTTEMTRLLPSMPRTNTNEYAIQKIAISAGECRILYSEYTRAE